MNDQFYTISQYIENGTDLYSRIVNINNLINALELKLLESIDSAIYDEYEMHDGQMRVKTKFRSIADVQKGLDSLEMLKQRYVNRYNGRVTILRGGKL